MRGSKTTPVGVNLTRSLVIYWAAQSYPIAWLRGVGCVPLLTSVNMWPGGKCQGQAGEVSEWGRLPSRLLHQPEGHQGRSGCRVPCPCCHLRRCQHHGQCQVPSHTTSSTPLPLASRSNSTPSPLSQEASVCCAVLYFGLCKAHGTHAIKQPFCVKLTLFAGSLYPSAFACK